MKIYAFAGSFNPPHIGHIMAINNILEDADRVHVFVRINESLDIVDEATKMGWFEKIKENLYDYGWDKVILHPAKSEEITGKSYSLKTVKDSFRKLDDEAGEHITHYYAGDDYKKYKLIFPLLFPDTKLVIGPRTPGLSSTELRNNLELNRYLLPDFIYEDLKDLKER